MRKLIALLAAALLMGGSVFASSSFRVDPSFHWQEQPAPRYTIASAADLLAAMPLPLDASYRMVMNTGPLAYYPLREMPVTSGAMAGVALDFMGRYNGAVSGTTYYNQVTVSGALSPDATGTYTVAGMYNRVPYWYNSSNGYYLFCCISNSHYYISAGSPVANPVTPSWISNSQNALIGGYNAGTGAYGTAVLANVTASVVYLFVPSGVTQGAQGPVLNGAQALGAGFNGAGGYINLGTPTTFGSATSFSISAWAYCTSSLSSVPHVMASRGTTGGRWWLRWEASGQVSAYIGDGTNGGYILSSSSVSLSTWHHLCAVFNRSNNYSYLYIDGIVQTPVSIAAVGSCDNNGKWNIGDDPDGNNYRYIGTLACVGVWKRALKQSEIIAMVLAHPNLGG